MIRRTLADNWLLYLSLLLLALFFILLPTADNARELILANASAAWPSTNGEVTLASPGGSEEVNRALLAYAYYVNDQRYISRRLSFGPGTLPPELQEPAALLDVLRVGTKVTVYYDPGTPSSAVLYPGNGYDLKQYAPQVVAILVVLGLLLAIGVRLSRPWGVDERNRFPGSVDNLHDAPPPSRVGNGAHQ